ncbi:hypothetical protein B0H13DRAFT_2352417 [Mycena leptocephala]|nr:hypothetical protein B0H13DRAFT_2352417 [Mycena leptocephala]
MSPEYLEMTYNDFANPDGTVLILHVTSGAGEGLDVPEINGVINYGKWPPHRIMITSISAALFSATSRKMLYAFAATRPVNPSGVQPAITEEQLWKGLEYKARNPVPFVPVISSSKTTFEEGNKLVRELTVTTASSTTIMKEEIESYAAAIMYFEINTGLRITHTISYGPNDELLLTMRSTSRTKFYYRESHSMGFLTTSAALRPNKFLRPPQLIHHLHNSLCSILEAKAPNTMDSENAWTQVTAQGAALCLLTKRPSVVNTWTDGLHWQFVHITKMPDQGSISPPLKAARSERTSTSTTGASASHQDGSRKSLLRLAKKPALPPVAETKPFKAAMTHILNIFHGRDLAIVLRLLTLAILSSPEEFEKLAEKETTLSSA